MSGWDFPGAIGRHCPANEADLQYIEALQQAEGRGGTKWKAQSQQQVVGRSETGRQSNNDRQQVPQI